MCEECGCSINHKEDTHKEVVIFKKVLEKNDHQAEENRRHFEEHGVFAINLMSSPGAGLCS